jgi:hypothetical protein
VTKFVKLGVKSQPMVADRAYFRKSGGKALYLPPAAYLGLLPNP